jgi:N-glycosylase/DNA lyase
VANRFRSLWGKEAGWAHSVLFTADLKAFSERLVAKAEVKEEEQSVKSEADGVEEVNNIVRTKTVTKKRVKRALEKDEHQVLEVKEKVVKRNKRWKT